MNLKLITGLLLLQYYCLCNTQKIADNGIYKTGKDFENKVLMRGFDNKERKTNSLKTPWKNEVLVKEGDSLFRFSFDDIWGYRQNKLDWRIYYNSIYNLTYAGKICIYEVPDYTPGPHSAASYYFSTGLTSPVINLNKSNLETAFRSDTSFVSKVKALSWRKSIFKINKKTGDFEFIEWLK